MLTAVMLAINLDDGQADCANSCSGHGHCGAFDQCTCFNGFRSADCSERLCPSSSSWASTPKGDFNFDGFVKSAATYESTTRFMKHNDWIYDQSSLGGSWELWPSFATANEAHFESECSDRGICDRRAGECQCFTGFTGSACQRSTCPNDCSGNGLCLSIQDHLVLNGNVGIDGSFATYNLWDAQKMRSCVCDPGFSGVDCSKRVCPFGDDPLTTKYQIDEMQFVKVFADQVSEASVKLNWDNSVGTLNVLGGSISFVYENLHGQKYQTEDIPISRWSPSEASSQTMAALVEAALEALPNNHLPDVTVSSKPCGAIEKGAYTLTTAAASGATSDVFFRCPNFGSTTDVLYWDGTQYEEFNTDTDSLTAPTGIELDGCELVAYPECIEFQITFVDKSTTGDLKDLQVDMSKVTWAGKTNQQLEVTAVRSTVSDSKVITAADLDTTVYIASSTSATNIANDVIVSTSTASGQTTLSLTGSVPVYTFPKGARVKISCQPGASGNWYTVGSNSVETTVVTVSSSAWSLVLSEEMYDAKSRCAAAAAIKIELLTSFISVNAKLDEAITAGRNGIYLKDPSAVDYLIESTIESMTVYANGIQYLLLSETPGGLTADVTCGTADCEIQVSGKGSTEADECSHRGMCDTDTGRCDCFKGYIGAACQTQDSLNA